MTMRFKPFSAGLLAGVATLLLASCAGSPTTDTRSGTGEPNVIERQESGALIYEQSSEASSLPNQVSIIPVPSSSATGMTSSQPVTGSMTITEEPDRTEANPGERIWYTIIIANQTNVSMEELVVENTLPSSKMTVIDPSGGILAGDRLTWQIQSLGSGQSRLLRFQGQIAKTVKHGDSILNIATLRGGRLPVTVTATSDVKVISKLPQTGAGDYTKPLEDTSKYLKPYHP